MRFQTLDEWLVWLETCHPRAIDLGLDRVARVTDRLAPDLSGTTVITVAGTNGKGSCVAALEALCMAAGLKVGCYTSPHLLRYNERIRIQAQEVGDDRIVAAFDRVDCALAGESLTYFEFGTLAALDIFQRAGLDVVVLEVGLGGRLDAVNVVDADIAIVTSVALDHIDWLGDNREAIGFEKAGIFRAGKPAICADADPPGSLCQHAGTIGAELMLVQRDFELAADDSGYTWRGAGNPVASGLSLAPGSLGLPLPSIAAAFQAAAILGIDRQYWSSVQKVVLPGRFQALQLRQRHLLLDVAHNPQAAGYLAGRLASRPCGGRRQALFAVMADKDIEAIIAPLRNSFAHWWVAGLPAVPRAIAPQALAQRVRAAVGVPVSIIDDIETAANVVIADMQPQDELVVFGSFFTVAAILRHAPALPIISR